MTDKKFEEDQRGGLSRRTIVRGAAWSVPVITVAVATPLAAASEPPCTVDPNDVVLERIDFRRDSEEGWSGELVNPTTSARTGTPVIVADQTNGVGMFARYQMRNDSDCTFTGQIRFQIDLPSNLMRSIPHRDGWTTTSVPREPVNGRSYTTFYITGTVAIAPGATYATRINWSIATIPELAAVWGAPEGPYRWTGSPATEGMNGYLVGYVGGGIRVSGAPASQFAAPDNGTAVVPGRNPRSFFVGVGRSPMPPA